MTPAAPVSTSNSGGHRTAFVLFMVVVAATWWRPLFPVEQALHHSLTVVAVFVLAIVHRRRPLPVGSFVLILVFLTLHSLAARWIYSFVPYDDWTQLLTGVRIGEAMGWHRNHFDRLVHLAYGLCFGAVLFRVLAEQYRWRLRWAAVGAVEIVLSTSAVYELFEWLIAATLAPGAAEAYNGQQGDMWDAHTDMALATVGAMVAVCLLLSARNFGRRRSVRSSPDVNCPAAHRR